MSGMVGRGSELVGGGSGIVLDAQASARWVSTLMSHCRYQNRVSSSGRDCDVGGGA